jgi:hypothetical protein
MPDSSSKPRTFTPLGRLDNAPEAGPVAAVCDRRMLNSPKGQRGGAEQYKAENIFWVPQEARWSHLQARAKQPTTGKDVDDAMDAIERDNPRLKGALNKNYGRPARPAAADAAERGEEAWFYSPLILNLYAQDNCTI